MKNQHNFSAIYHHGCCGIIRPLTDRLPFQQTGITFPKVYQPLIIFKQTVVLALGIPKHAAPTIRIRSTAQTYLITVIHKWHAGKKQLHSCDHPKFLLVPTAAVQCPGCIMGSNQIPKQRQAGCVQVPTQEAEFFKEIRSSDLPLCHKIHRRI